MLFRSRAIQGVGGGLAQPLGPAMLYRAFPVREIGKALGLFGLVLTLAPAVGPLLGGVLVDAGLWRTIFFLNLPIGVVGVTEGPWMAATDSFEVTFRGRGAHAAIPHAGVDPVVALAHAVTALQSIVSRNADPLKELVVSVTQLRAGTAFNIIPETAWMSGTVRCFDRALWTEVPEHFTRIVKGVAAAMGCEAEITYDRGNLPTVNAPEVCVHARAAATQVVGEANLRTDVRTMGGEDFSIFLDKVPGVFMAIGSRNESRGLTHDHHHPRFDVDEESLRIGAEVLLETTRRVLAS